jgi:hypothetical protein
VHNLTHRNNKYLPISDIAITGGVFGSSIKERLALLPSKSLGMRDGYLINSFFEQRFFHFFEFVRLDYGFYLVHDLSPYDSGLNYRYRKKNNYRKPSAEGLESHLDE